MVSTAIFSSCKKYRYTLTRIWDSKKPLVMFIGLNPSTADEIRNDPTVARCINFAQAWGYGGMIMTNIFAYRSTNPYAMMSQEDPVGLENDAYLVDSSRQASLIMAVWGIHGSLSDRGKQVVKLMKAAGCELHHLGMTKEGYPKHPLYLKKTVKPERWEI